MKRVRVRNPRSEWVVTYDRSLAIISMDWWRNACRRRAESRANSPLTGTRWSRNTVQPSTLFSGTLVCAYCGSELKLNRSSRSTRSQALACLNGTNEAHRCLLRSSKSTKIIEECLLGFLLTNILTDAVVEQLVREGNEYLAKEGRKPRTDVHVAEKKVKACQSKIDRFMKLIERAEGDEVVERYHKQISKLHKELSPLLAEARALRARNAPPPPPLDVGSVLGYLKDARELLNHAVPVAALAIRALTGKIKISQEVIAGRKRGARWIAHFRPNLIQFLAHYTGRHDIPDALTLDVLSKRIWNQSHEVTVTIEERHKFQVHATAAAEMRGRGVSVPAIAAILKVTIHTVEDALYYFRTGEAPPRRAASKLPRKVGKRASFKEIAPLVAKLKDNDGISLNQIARTNGWSRQMVGRAYTYAHPERASEAAEYGSKIRSPQVLRAEQIVELRKLRAEGRLSARDIAARVGCSEPSVYYHSRKR